jgi:hypothetical protein
MYKFPSLLRRGARSTYGAEGGVVGNKIKKLDNFKN